MTTSTIIAVGLSLDTDLDLVIGERPGCTCPGCGKYLPGTRGTAVVELERATDGAVICRTCAGRTNLGLARAAALLQYVHRARSRGQATAAKQALNAVLEGLDLLDEFEAEQQHERGRP